jgi:nucleoid-associated protein YgaU
MALAELTIGPCFDAQFDEFEVMFNPNTYTVSKTVTWRSTSTVLGHGRGNGAANTDSTANAPTTSFGGGGSRQLSLELFFDTTELEDEAQDVRLETDKLVQLTLIERSGEKGGRPPVCAVRWGPSKTADFPFIGTVSSLTQRFVLFTSEGVPLRATLNVTFTEFLERVQDQKETDPETTTRTVRRGDTLASIAAEAYRDAGLWRTIAEANRIDDPLSEMAGRSLVIPKLERQRRGAREPK